MQVNIRIQYNNGVWKIFDTFTYEDLGWRHTKAEAEKAVRDGPR